MNDLTRWSVGIVVALLGCTGASQTTLDATPLGGNRDATPHGDGPRPTADAPTVAVPDHGSLLFSGASQYVEIPGSSTLGGYSSFTLEAWVKPLDAAGAAHAIIGKNYDGPSDESSLVRRLEGNAQMEIWGTDGSGCIAYGGTIPQNAWTHVAGSYSTSDGSPIIYVNGQLVDTSACSNKNFPSTLNEFLIGAIVSNGQPGSFWHGNIDEVRIWNVQRSQAAIQSTMSKTLVGNEAGLVGYWNFEDGSGDNVHDLSGHANDGFLGSAHGSDPGDPTWSNDVPGF